MALKQKSVFKEDLWAAVHKQRTGKSDCSSVCRDVDVLPLCLGEERAEWEGEAVVLLVNTKQVSILHIEGRCFQNLTKMLPGHLLGKLFQVSPKITYFEIWPVHMHHV